MKQSKESRLKNLHEKCDAVEEISYDKSFTVSEMAEIKDQLADESIKLSDVEAEFKEVKLSKK